MRAFGPYRSLRRLGQGAMGEVHLVEHAQTGARYALKVLPELDAESRLRFAREGQAMAAAGAHPNLIRVHALELHAPLPYLVLELAEGGDLQARLREGPLPPTEAVALVAAAARGVAHAHAGGVLHRDLKPANVLLDGEGRPKITDFGLARLEGAQRLTQTGTLLGTPLYMAPEQALSESELDARTDVYGLGGILYACLSGRPPVKSGGSLPATLAAVLEQLPPPPSRFNPAVEPWLDELCLRALAKDPSERFASAAELAEALAAGEASGGARWQLWAAAAVALLILGALALSGADSPTRAPAASPTPSPASSASPASPEPERSARAWQEIARGLARDLAPAPELIAAWRAACAAAEREGGAELPRCRLELLRAYHRRGQDEELLREAEPWLDHPRLGPELHYRCSEVRWQRYEMSRAEQHYEALAQRDDEWGQLGAALRLRCRLIPWGPQSVKLFQSNLGQRRATLTPLLELPDPLGEAAARALTQTQSSQERRLTLEARLRRTPDDASLVLAQAGHQLDRAELGAERDEALAAAQALIERAAGLCAPRGLLNVELKRARLLRLRGELEGAAALLRDELARRPEALIQRIRLGELEEQLGRPLQAMRTWIGGSNLHPTLVPYVASRPFPLRRRLARAFGFVARPDLKLIGPLSTTLSAWRAELPAAARRAALVVLRLAYRGAPWGRLEVELERLLELDPQTPELLLFAAELALGRARNRALTRYVEAARASGADPLRCDVLDALPDPASWRSRPPLPASHPARPLELSLRLVGTPEPYDPARERVGPEAPAWVRRMAWRVGPQRGGPGLPQRIQEGLAHLGFADANLAFASAAYTGLQHALESGDWGGTLKLLASLQGLLPQPTSRATSLEVFLLAPADQRAPFHVTMDLWKAELEERLGVGSLEDQAKVRCLLRLIRGMERMGATPLDPGAADEVAADLRAGLALSPIRDYIAHRYRLTFGRSLR